jgi:hypothetical protein
MRTFLAATSTMRTRWFRWIERCPSSCKEETCWLRARPSYARSQTPSNERGFYANCLCVVSYSALKGKTSFVFFAERGFATDDVIDEGDRCDQDVASQSAVLRDRQV